MAATYENINRGASPKASAFASRLDQLRTLLSAQKLDRYQMLAMLDAGLLTASYADGLAAIANTTTYPDAAFAQIEQQYGITSGHGRAVLLMVQAAAAHADATEVQALLVNVG